MSLKGAPMIWLYNSRIIAIFAVVVLHTSAHIVTGSNVGSGYWWIGNIYDSSVRWCVPVFVMISGALLLDPNKNEVLKTFYAKRLSRILPPVLFWSAFFLMWIMLNGIEKGSNPTLVYLLKKLVSGKPYYHMWFLYMIIPLYLFTPFFRKIIAKSTRIEIVILVVITFLMAALNYIAEIFSGGGPSKLFINWFLFYIPFYFLGYLIRTDERNFSKVILWCVFLFSSCLTALGCYLVSINKGLDAGLYFYGYLSITVIPMSVSMMYLLKSWTTPIYNDKFTILLSSLTLGVYLIHPIAIDILKYINLSPLSFYPAVSIPVIAIIVFISSLMGSWVIYKTPYLKRLI